MPAALRALSGLLEDQSSGEARAPKRGLAALHLVLSLPHPREAADADVAPQISARSPSITAGGGLHRVGSELEWAAAAHSSAMVCDVDALVAECEPHLAELGVKEACILVLREGAAAYHACFRRYGRGGAAERVPELPTLDPATAAALETANLPAPVAHIASRARRVHSFVAQVRDPQRASACASTAPGCDRAAVAPCSRS